MAAQSGGEYQTDRDRCALLLLESYHRAGDKGARAHRVAQDVGGAGTARGAKRDRLVCDACFGVRKSLKKARRRAKAVAAPTAASRYAPYSRMSLGTALGWWA